MSAPWEAGSLCQDLSLSYCCLALGAFCREAPRMHLERSRWHLQGSALDLEACGLAISSRKGNLSLCMELKRVFPPGPEDLEMKEGKSLSPPGGWAQARTVRSWHPPHCCLWTTTASKGVGIMSSDSTVPSTQPHRLPGSTDTPVHKGMALWLDTHSTHIPWLPVASELGRTGFKS